MPKEVLKLFCIALALTKEVLIQVNGVPSDHRILEKLHTIEFVN